MTCNWANNLDMLAQNKVIDFDAASYIMGQPLRYVGNPENPDPFTGQPPVMTNLQQPNIDEFKPANDKKDIVKTPAWKKWAFGFLAAGALIFGGFKFRSKLIPGIKNFINKISFKSIKNFFKNNKLKGFFHKKKP